MVVVVFVWSQEVIVMFAILEICTGELLGACGICYIDWINRNADFSICIGKDLGFSLEGCHKETHWTEGEWCDSLFYGILVNSCCK